MESLTKLFEQISGSRVLVVGDIFLDEYIHGTIDSFSTEAPIPVVESDHRSFVLNAAAYAALLMKHLGLDVQLVGVVGRDANGAEALRLLQKAGLGTDGIVEDEGFTTLCQTRISVAGPHYPEQDILRINTQRPNPLGETTRQALSERAVSLMDGARAVVFVDKVKSAISSELVEVLRQHANDDTLFIGDSERALGLFRGFTAVTPNQQEAERALAKRMAPADSAKAVQELLACEYVFLTRGSEGMDVVSPGEPAVHLPTHALHVFDVNGAGETVLAAVTAGLLAGWSAVSTGEFANLAAGLAVAQPGLADITIDEILAFERRQSAELQADKILTLPQLKKVLDQARAEGKRIVWTNGCYDIMHVGHILYLEKAKALGDLLVVGLNSDASVRKYKGPLRPIVSEDQRAKLLTSLTCVDYVIIFDDPSPIELIDALRPHIYAKGGDYTINTINQQERRLVESYGGEIALLPGVEGMSTTQIIERILKAYGSPAERPT